eukprot:7683-Heterococcus_DN1.PRE.4
MPAPLQIFAAIGALELWVLWQTEDREPGDIAPAMQGIKSLGPIALGCTDMTYSFVMQSFTQQLIGHARARLYH